MLGGAGLMGLDGDLPRDPKGLIDVEAGGGGEGCRTGAGGC